MDLSVSCIYGEALDLTKKYGFRALGLVFLLVIAVVVTMFATMFLTLPSNFFGEVAGILGGVGDRSQIYALYGKMAPALMIAVIVGQFLYVGYYGYLIAIARGQEVSLFSGFNRPALTYVKFFVVQLLCSLIMIVGCIALLFPGIYLGVRLCWASFHVLDAPECGIFEAFQWSWEKTDGQFLTLFGLFLVAFGINMGASVLFQLLGLGAALAGPIVTLLFALLQMVFSLFVSVFIQLAQFKTFVTLADGEDYNEYE